MKVIAIAAVGKNGSIGKENGLPWNIPEDMSFFKRSTRNQIVLMGRKSFDAIGKALPHRENGVITRDPVWKRDGVLVFHDIKTAIDFYKNDSRFIGKELFVIGGSEIYLLSFPMLDEVWLTEIETEFEADAFFPFYMRGKLERPEFEITSREPQKDFVQTSHRYSFNRYTRKV